jgi:hypothetical protein
MQHEMQHEFDTICKKQPQGVTSKGLKFYTFLMYFAETNPKYFPAMRI